VERFAVPTAEEASSEDVAEEPGDGVRVEDSERVVTVVQLLLEEHHGDPRHAAGADAHQHGRSRVHQSCMCVDVQDNCNM